MNVVTPTSDAGASTAGNASTAAPSAATASSAADGALRFRLAMALACDSAGCAVDPVPLCKTARAFECSEVADKLVAMQSDASVVEAFAAHAVERLGVKNKMLAKLRSSRTRPTEALFSRGKRRSKAVRFECGTCFQTSRPELWASLWRLLNPGYCAALDAFYTALRDDDSAVMSTEAIYMAAAACLTEEAAASAAATLRSDIAAVAASL